MSNLLFYRKNLQLDFALVLVICHLHKDSFTIHIYIIYIYIHLLYIDYIPTMYYIWVCKEAYLYTSFHLCINLDLI